MTRIGRRACAVLCITLAMLTGIVWPGGVASAEVSDPLIEGLSGPLGLAVGAGGTLYVTESFGPGRLTAVRPDGSAVVLLNGPNGIAGVDVISRDTLAYTTSESAGEDQPPTDTRLERLRSNGTVQPVASIQDYEFFANPDQGNTYGLVGASQACTDQVNGSPLAPATYTGILESNPYAMAIIPGGYVVADAAANAIFRVRHDGTVSTLAVLPPVANLITPEYAQFVLDEFGVDVSDCIGETYLQEPVPTDVEVGPDGHLYVTTLPGSEAPGQGKVWKINRQTGAVALVTDGLFTPVDLAVASDGTIYVAELFPGQITTIENGVVTDSMPLDSPGAIEIGPDGTIYATTGVFGNGAVVTVTP